MINEGKYRYLGSWIGLGTCILFAFLASFKFIDPNMEPTGYLTEVATQKTYMKSIFSTLAEGWVASGDIALLHMLSAILTISCITLAFFTVKKFSGWVLGFLAAMATLLFLLPAGTINPFLPDTFLLLALISTWTGQKELTKGKVYLSAAILLLWALLSSWATLGGIITTLLIAKMLHKENKHLALGLHIGMTALTLLYWGTWPVVDNVPSFMGMLNVSIVVAAIFGILQLGKTAIASKVMKAVLLYVLLPLSIASSLQGIYIQGIGSGYIESLHQVESFCSRTQVDGPIFNNRPTIGEAGLFTKRPTYYSKLDENIFRKQDSIFDLVINDELAWISFRDQEGFNTIYFDLSNQSEAVFLFLGRRLADTEWSMIYLEREKKVILARRSSSNYEGLKHLEIVPN